MSAAKEILLGPFLIAGGDRSYEDDPIFFTGHSLQFSTSMDGFEVPIYYFGLEGTRSSHFTEYMFPVDHCPMDFTCRPSIDCHHNSKGAFVTLSRLIAAMFGDFNASFPVTEFLQKFAQALPFQGDLNLPDTSTLKPEFAEKGFAVSGVISYGDCIVVSFCWSPVINSFAGKAASNISCGMMQFRPRPDGSLGNGKWWEPREGSIGLRLFEVLRKVAGSESPLGCFSAAGIKRCLDSFEWLPKHKMSKSELASKRLEVIKESSSLWDDPRGLAQALKDQGLYSISTDINQIKRHVEKSLASISKSSAQHLQDTAE